MNKFKVEFKRSNGQYITLGYCSDVYGKEVVLGEYSPNLRNASKMIHRFLTNYPSFKSYYTRINGPAISNNGEKTWCFDVGSWSEFFYVTETAEEVEDNYYVELFELKHSEVYSKEMENDNE